MGNKSDLIIYTIGTSNRTFEEFLDIIAKYGIKSIVDVRSFPTSKFFYFKKEYLEKNLPERGIIYNFLGKDLGGFRKEGYINYKTTESFVRGVQKLENIAKDLKTAFFCAERFPWKCHRRWISEELSKRGWKVIHIIDKEKIWEPKN